MASSSICLVIVSSNIKEIDCSYISPSPRFRISHVLCMLQPFAFEGNVTQIPFCCSKQVKDCIIGWLFKNLCCE